MFCRIALISLVACLIVYPVATVDLVHAGWSRVLEASTLLGYYMGDQIVPPGGIIIENDRLQHREMH